MTTAPTESDGEQTVKLTRPCTMGDEIIRELTFREPKGRDMGSISFGTGEDGIRLGVMLDLAKVVCLQPGATKIIDELCIADTMAVAGVMGGFFGDGEATGPTALEP